MNARDERTPCNPYTLPLTRLVLVLLLYGCGTGSHDASNGDVDIAGDVQRDSRDDTDSAATTLLDCGWAWGEMVEIPSGTAVVGRDCAPCDVWQEFQRPAHSATIAAFAIDRVPVTNGAFAAFLQSNGEDCGGTVCRNPMWAPDQTQDDVDDLGVPGKERLPAGWTTWAGARAFCAWHGRRLCSEAEWEYAARGAEGWVYPWGDEAPDETRGNCGWPCGWPFRERVAIGCFPEGASPFGVLDMVGNVFERVEDDWHDSHVGAPSSGAPWTDEPRSGGHVSKGSGLMKESFPLHLAAPSARSESGDRSSGPQMGFRCCADQLP